MRRLRRSGATVTAPPLPSFPEPAVEEGAIAAEAVEGVAPAPKPSLWDRLRGKKGGAGASQPTEEQQQAAMRRGYAADERDVVDVVVDGLSAGGATVIYGVGQAAEAVAGALHPPHGERRGPVKLDPPASPADP